MLKQIFRNYLHNISVFYSVFHHYYYCNQEIDQKLMIVFGECPRQCLYIITLISIEFLGVVVRVIMSGLLKTLI